MGQSHNKKEGAGIIELDTSRRQLLRAASGAGIGLAGFKTAIEEVTGESHDGVPVVYTRDKQGMPDKVRMVSRERYRRLRTYCNIDYQSIFESNQGINEISLKQFSSAEEDIGLHLQIEDGVQREQISLPNSAENLPVTYETNSLRYCQNDDNPCNDPNNEARVCEHFNEMKGGIQISDDSSFGTLCFVGKDSDDGYEKLITAEHVMDNTQGNIYQPDYSCINDRSVGSHDTDDIGEDIWAGQLDTDSASASVGKTVDEIPDITGYWTWEGLSDHTTTDSVQCLIAGARTEIKQNWANKTAYSNYSVDHAVVYGQDKAEGGDSGAPYVDLEGNLVSMHNSCSWVKNIPDAWDVGTQAEYVLEAANATLS